MRWSIIAMVGYGNAGLAGDDVDLSLENSVFQFCNSIEFVQPHTSGDREQEICFSKDFHGWLQYLRERKVSRLYLRDPGFCGDIIADYERFIHKKGFVVQKENIIEACHDGLSDIWVERMDVTEEKNRRKWRVTYGEIVRDRKMPIIETLSLEAVYTALQDALKDISTFAESRKETTRWQKNFLSALECLQSQDPFAELRLKDMIPKWKYSLIAQQLLGASLTGYVFGGMGSWYDVWFQGDVKKEYERVTNRLAWCISDAIISAVNSYDPVIPG